MKLEELFNFIRVKKIEGPLSETEINKITQDTREVEPGDVFICIEGESFDGHEYAQMAVEKGAIAIVAEKTLTMDTKGVPVVYVTDTRKIMTILANVFYHYPSKDLTVIGVTGTNGKTTVTYLIDTMLKDFGKKTGMIGTIEMHIDNEIFPTINTTPDNLTLQSSLRKMLDKDVEVCSIEVSSHSLVQGRTWGIDMNVAVLTNVTHEHLDYHKTMEEYRHAKELLFTQLGNSWKGQSGKVAVLNKDDETYASYSQITPAEVISYSIKDQTADFFAEDIRFNSSGTHFNLVVLGESYLVHTNLVGEYNVSNALAALAAVYAVGVPLEKAVTLINGLEVVEGRLQPMKHTDGYDVYVDYAHSPDALEKVLSTMKPLTEGRLINIMGCQGSRDMEKRPIMGRIATENADLVVFTTDSPEMEDQADIFEMVLSGVEKDNYIYIEDRREAMFHTIANAQPGDVIVITGRGHEKTYRVGKKSIEFLDATVAQEAVDHRNTQEKNERNDEG